MCYLLLTILEIHLGIYTMINNHRLSSIILVLYPPQPEPMARQIFYHYIFKISKLLVILNVVQLDALRLITCQVEQTILLPVTTVLSHTSYCVVLCHPR